MNTIHTPTAILHREQQETQLVAEPILLFILPTRQIQSKK